MVVIGTGCLISSRVAGAGPPLVLLHELGCSGDIFLPLTAHLRHTHQVVVPDLRGHGASHELGYPPCVADLARDVLGLLDVLELAHATVLGYGSGGLVAQQLAFDAPTRVDRLVLVCSCARYGSCRREGTEPPVWSVPAALGRAARQVAGALGRRARTPVAAELVDAVADFDSSPWLDRLSQPTLVVVGARDHAVPPSRQLQLSGWLPRPAVRLVNGGHELLWSRAEQLAGIVTDWLDGAGTHLDVVH